MLSQVIYFLFAAVALADVVVVKLTQTVDNTVTHTNVVEGSMQTFTSYSTSATTTTTTVYTSTYTLTIFGHPYTYVSVMTLQPGQQPQGAQNNGGSTPKPALSTETPAVSPDAPNAALSIAANSAPGANTASTPVQNTPAQTTLAEPQASQQTAQPVNSSPSTPVTNTPSTSPTTSSPTSAQPLTTTALALYVDIGPSASELGWILDSVLTNVVSGVCIVDYQYYQSGVTETVTSTSTLYKTVTV